MMIWAYQLLSENLPSLTYNWKTVVLHKQGGFKIVIINYNMRLYLYSLILFRKVDCLQLSCLCCLVWVCWFCCWVFLLGYISILRGCHWSFCSCVNRSAMNGIAVAMQHFTLIIRGLCQAFMRERCVLYVYFIFPIT